MGCWHELRRRCGLACANFRIAVLILHAASGEHTAVLGTLDKCWASAGGALVTLAIMFLTLRTNFKPYRVAQG